MHCVVTCPWLYSCMIWTDHASITDEFGTTMCRTQPKITDDNGHPQCTCYLATMHGHMVLFDNYSREDAWLPTCATPPDMSMDKKNGNIFKTADSYWMSASNSVLI